MAKAKSAIYKSCPYLHHDPKHGQRVLDNLDDGAFRVLARLVSMVGPTEDADVEQRPERTAPAIAVTFEVVGADWAEGWLKLSEREWVSDVKGKLTHRRYSLGNAPLGRFTYEPSGMSWDMKLLNASLGHYMATPEEALRQWRQGATPEWFQAEVKVRGIASVPFCVVRYFSSIFDTGRIAKIHAVASLDKASLVKVGRRFRMPAVLKQSVQRLGAQLTRRRLKAEHLVVYDVGQGAAQAFVRLDAPHVTPELYVDMGCGQNHALDVALQRLKFCTSESPPVILSHADEDHWCGAVTKAMANAGYPAHTLSWSAPATSAKMTFMVFARSVWRQGGSVRTLDLAGVSPGTVTATTQSGTVQITQGTSKQFNYSGLIVTAISKNDQHYWLLPGDCDYHFFPAVLKAMTTKPLCVALTAFHHGAKPLNQVSVPLPASRSYRRLVYSFGCGNNHKHPTLRAATDHQASGWGHGSWVKAPGVTLPSVGSHARATAWTPPGAQPPYQHAGGVLIGWSAVSLPSAAVCCPVGCAAVVPKQV